MSQAGLDYHARIERLKPLASKVDVGDAIIYYNALQTTRQAYHDDPSAKNQADWVSARTGLEAALAKMEETHFPTEPMFDNLMAVVRHLQEQGYKIKKSKLYQDRKKGLLFVQPDGRVRESDLLAYVARADLQRLTDATGSLDDLHAEKSAKEIEKLTAQVEKLRFDLAKDRDKYILRTDFAAELAARAVLLEANLKNWMRTRIVDVIAAVQGDPSAAGAGLDLMLEALDRFLSEYASVDVFYIKNM